MKAFLKRPADLVKMGGHSLRGEMLDCLDFLNSNLYMDAVVKKEEQQMKMPLSYLWWTAQKFSGGAATGQLAPA